jgi:hypothetical protein
MIAESTVMEDVSAPSVDEWLRRTGQTRNIAEYLRKKKPLKMSPCKKGSVPFFSSVLDSPATRTARFGHYKTAQQCATKAQFEDAIVRDLAIPIAAVSAVPKEFHALATRWRTETIHVSSIPDLIMHPSYQQILRLPKDQVIPLILRELRDNGGFWYPALHALTDANPVSESDMGNVRKMTEAWLQWGMSEGWLARA